MSYHQMIAVTNRMLCSGDYLAQIERICQHAPRAVLLREKDLSPDAYTALARQIQPICQRYQVPLIIHNHPQTARTLQISRLHLPLSRLAALDNPTEWSSLGTSCHSVAQLQQALSLGVTYVFLGNVFETDCKPGLPGKGLDLLRTICDQSTVPVYAIGGISPANLPSVLEAGAAGGCMMSGFMQL